MVVHRGARILAQAARGVWLVYLLAAADMVAAAASLADSCPEQVEPVCGEDGLSYYNKCLAKAQKVEVSHDGYCKDAFFQFSSPKLKIRLEAAPARPRRMAPKERAESQMSADLINAYSSDGFVYVGRAQLAPRPHTHHHADNSSSSSSSIGSKESNQNSSSRGQQELGSLLLGKVLPSWVSAVRFTPQGHVYIAKELDSQQQQQQQEQQQTAAAADLSIRPQVPAAAARRRLAASRSRSSSSRRLGPAAAAAAAAPADSLQQKGRHLNIMVGTDERKVCPLGPTYPFSAIGQIDFEEAGTPYICSGALISQRRVLTAAHCVWDVESQSFVDVLSFAPGRFRGAGGKMVNPYGVFKWAHATLMKNYLTSDETQGDIAVVQLADPAPEAAGTLGLRANCRDDDSVQVTTAGYPSDQQEGECMTTQCTVRFDCERESTRHKCDTYMGQSGSSFWDDQYYIRGVHVRGLVDDEVNEFTTLSRRVMAKIREWEGQEKGGVL